jgi:hypothetical protein
MEIQNSKDEIRRKTSPCRNPARLQWTARRLDSGLPSSSCFRNGNSLAAVVRIDDSGLGKGYGKMLQS